LERETGLEPATFSLEGLGVYAQWHPSWSGEHFVSSYRVVLGTGVWADLAAQVIHPHCLPNRQNYSVDACLRYVAAIGDVSRSSAAGSGRERR
jgi:hypothetical protein